MRTAWLALVLWAGWQGAGPSTAVEIRTFQFSRTSLDVPLGTEVIWSNHDAVEHTVTSGVPDSADGAFAGRLTDSGVVFRYRFDRPGTYRYFCERHHFMRGEIRVLSHTHGES